MWRAGIQSGKLLCCQGTELSAVWSYLLEPGEWPELLCTMSALLLLRGNPCSHCPWAQTLLLDSLSIQRTRNSHHPHPGLQAQSQEVLVGIWADGTFHWGSGPVAWLSSLIHREHFTWDSGALSVRMRSVIHALYDCSWGDFAKRVWKHFLSKDKWKRMLKKKIVYMSITEPLCCTVETGTTLINFIDLFKEPSTLLIFNNVQ